MFTDLLAASQVLKEWKCNHKATKRQIGIFYHWKKNTKANNKPLFKNEAKSFQELLKKNAPTSYKEIFKK